MKIKLPPGQLEKVLLLENKEELAINNKSFWQKIFRKGE